MPSFQIQYEYLQGDASQYWGTWKWGATTFDLMTGCSADNNGNSNADFPLWYWDNPKAECGSQVISTNSSASPAPSVPFNSASSVPSSFVSSVPSNSASSVPSGSTSSVPSGLTSSVPSNSASSVPSGSTSSVPSGSTSSVPSNSASSVPSGSTSSVPSNSASSVPSGLTSSVPSNSASSVPSGSTSSVPSNSTSSVPSNSASSVPSGLTSSVPSNSASSVPSGSTSSVPSGLTSSVPSNSTSSVPSGSTSSVPSGLTSSVPSNSASSVPSGLTSSVPSGLTSSVPSGLTSSVPSGLTSSVPSNSASSVPSGSTSSVPSGLTSSVPSNSASSVPSGSTSSVPSNSASSVPSGSTSSVPSGSAPSAPPSSTFWAASSSASSVPSLNNDPSVPSAFSTINNDLSVTSGTNTERTGFESLIPLRSRSSAPSRSRIVDSTPSLSTSSSFFLSTSLATAVPFDSKLSFPSSASNVLIRTKSQVECETDTADSKLSILPTSSAANTIIPLTLASTEIISTVVTAAPYETTTLLTSETDISPVESLGPTTFTTWIPISVGPSYLNISSNSKIEFGSSVPRTTLPVISISSIMYTAPSGKVSGTLFGTDSSSDSTRTTMTVVPACTKTSEVFQCYTTADSTGLAPVHNPTFDYPGSIQSSNNGAFKASSEIANPIVQPSPSTITTEAVSCSSEATSYNEEASGNRTKKSITFEPSSGPSVLYPSTHTVTEFGSPAMIVTGKFETTVYVTCSCETDHWKSKQTDVAVTDQQLSSKSTIQDQGDQGIRTAFTTRTAHQVSASTSGVSESKSFTTNSSFSTVFGSTHIQASPTLSVYKGSATRMKLSFTALLLMLSWFF